MNAQEGDYAVEEIARAWFVKMRSEDAPALRAEFEEWLAAKPGHRAAYEQISRAMTASAVLKSSTRFGSEEARRRRAGTSAWRMPWGAAATGVLFLAAIFGVVSMSRPGPGSFAPSAYASEPLTTQRGEIRTFKLPDGSTATLDTESRLDLLYSAGERRVRLAKGRVRLKIASEKRPFIAEASAGTAQTDEAVMDLSVDEARTEFTHLSGQSATLRIHAPGVGAGRLRKVNAGVQVSISSKRGSAQLRQVSIKPERSDWPSGWAEYSRISLGSLVAEANRYANDPVIIDDPAVAELAVSGRFNLKNTGAFARRISQLFGLALDEQPDGIHLSRF